MEFTEKEQKQLAATPWLTENQKQAVSLLRSLSEEEVAEVIEWTTPILACLPSTNDVKQTLQDRGVAIDDKTVAAVVANLNESMWAATGYVQQLIESAIDELVAEREQAAGQSIEGGKPQTPTSAAAAAKAAAGPTYEDIVKWFNEDRLVEAGIPVEGQVTD